MAYPANVISRQSCANGVAGPFIHQNSKTDHGDVDTVLHDDAPLELQA
jgi:hypothetical protein